jgi:hypothetical protein
MAKTRTPDTQYPKTIDDLTAEQISEGVLTRILGWTPSLLDQYLTRPDGYCRDDSHRREERYFRRDRVAVITKQFALQPALSAERDELAKWVNNHS